jgi:hypothetical protein
MAKFLSVLEEITKHQKDNDVFIKVLTFDQSNGATNADVFYKVNERYRKVSTSELPENLVSFIAAGKGVALEGSELKAFEEYTSRTNLLSNTKIDCVQTIFGQCLHTDYMITKDKDADYYVLQQAIPNEFGKLVTTTPIISSLIPYIFADVVDKGNKFKDQVFLIDKNLFTKTCEIKNRTLGIIYQFDDENGENGKFTVIGLFGIEKDFSGKYKVLTTEKDLKVFKDIDKVLDEQTSIFVKKLSLQMVN